MTVTVAWSPAKRQVQERPLQLPAGATLGDALDACPEARAFALQDAARPLHTGVWGRRLPLSTVLHEGDRVELYRPLQVDPMVARRERFQKQGSKKAGLFAQRRPGAKPGY
ncbi:MAG: hypothetical protein RLZZ126_1864 [Pseudomonadota bacterium]